MLFLMDAATAKTFYSSGFWEHNAKDFATLLSPEIIIKPYNIIFFKIRPDLYFN